MTEFHSSAIFRNTLEQFKTCPCGFVTFDFLTIIRISKKSLRFFANFTIFQTVSSR